MVTGDGARLHQVLANLLANARTHTPAGTTVTATVAAEGHDAVVRVEDDGPGIPESVLPTVFGRFVRGESSRSRAHGSTGLGLAIVHGIVAAHGGRVDVASHPGRTVFAVRLPSSRPPRRPSNPSTPDPCATPGHAEVRPAVHQTGCR
ncbi:hypothetical protein GCM10025868_21300 [Angustibacter aerolatus]|uniref:histidine kinase n=1 Tax=Angustibacter aerolatus TaxID=1162965 RepID=A0ABQ6JFC8_9ACTN|nr:ATP-binding protein [Angustibacter aerolatus]GMA86880.1 hypothetical protein GCM10025868_21300 [Angustibacter aerolatus]